MSERDGIRVGVFGNSDSGKTVLTQYLTKDEDRLVLFDPKRTYRKRARELGYYVCRDMADFLDTLQDNWDTGFRLIFEPRDADRQKQLAGICELIWKLQTPYMMGEPGEKITLVIEEIHTAAPNPPGKEGEAFLNAVSMLREGGVNIIGATQRPQRVATDFRDLLSRAYFMQPAGIKAATAMAEVGTGEDDLKDAIMALQRWHFIFYENGKWEPHEPVKL